MLLPPRARLVLLSAFVVSVAALASCDASDPARTAPETDELRMSPIPPGGRLLEPGSAGQGARRTQAAGDASAYGCVVSTLQADGSGPAYGYDAVYVHLPDRLVRQAGGRMAHATFVLRSEHAPAHAATAFNGAEGRGGVVRVARCRLPESAEVGVVIGRALQEFHEGSWVGPRSTAGNVAGDAGASARTASASYCAEWVDVWWCTTVTAEGSDYEYTRCEYEGRECARYVSVYDPPSGGGSPPGSGDDPDPCPSGPTDQLCVGGPGGGVVPTDPDPDPEPCDTGYAVIDAPGFQAGVEAAWNASNAQASDPYDRRERGGWIIRDPSSGAVSIVPIAGATYTPCGIDAPPGTVPPNGTIGLFHTHPYAVGDYADYEPCRRYNAVQRFPGLSRSHIDTLLDEIPQGTFPNTPYAGTPSDADVTTVRDIAAAYGVPDFLGIIADKDGFVVFDKNSTADQARGEHITITACGYDPTE